MVKNILTLSMVASLALFSVGCGGGGSDSTTDTTNDQQVQQDTTAPEILTATPIDAPEETNTTVNLTANESNVTFSIVPADHFSLADTVLTFEAPAYDANGGNEYNVTVKATDAANNVGEKVLTFNVVERTASITPVAVGDKQLTVDGDTIIGPAGLKWLNDNAPIMTYDEAVQYCESKNYRIARRDEILNLMNYKNTTGRALEDEFISTASYSWAKQVDGTYFAVHLVTGTDTDVADPTTQYSVLCTQGASAPAHTFTVSEDDSSVIIDNDTLLRWTQVSADQENRRALDPQAADKPADVDPNPQAAADYCAALGGFRLPTINELRALVDYDTNLVNSSVVPSPEVNGGDVLIWSDTDDFSDNTKSYYLNANKKGLLKTDAKYLSYYITCVKGAE